MTIYSVLMTYRGINEMLACLRHCLIPYGRHILISQIRVPQTTVALALAFSANLSNASAQKFLTADEMQIVGTVKTIFVAFLTDDFAMLNTVIAPDFYIYDGGARFNADGIVTLIKAQQAAGKRFEWKVTEADVHISGNTAWIAYVNKGSITSASGTANQKWLESAFLEKQAGVWKIVFMHSTRVPTEVEGNHGK
jgi:ketosteroid isomerase-like protein